LELIINNIIIYYLLLEMETPQKTKQNPIGLPVINNRNGLGAPGAMPVTPVNKTKPVNQTGLTPQKMLLSILGGKRRKTNARRKARSLKHRNNKSTRRR
jgi:hypothetical protein